MKKRIIISLLCGLIICCIAVYSFGTTGIVNPDTLRLRSSNSTDSSILTLLSSDEKVEIVTRTDNGWYKVKYTDAITNKQYEGYVDERYITVKEENQPTNTPSEENKTSEGGNNTPSQEVDTNEKVGESTTKVINKGEKVYLIPLINSNTANVLENDANVEVMTELNGWSYVASNDFEGWIRTEKLQEAKAKKKIGSINTNSVNFREQPTTSSTSMLKFERNAEVEIIEENDGWAKVSYQGTVGYVTINYVSDSKVQTTSRSSTTRRTAITTTTNAPTETIVNAQATPVAQDESATPVENTANTTNVSNGTGSEIVAYAKQYLGYKYVAGGASPAGFDCSGFTQYVYKHFGYSLSRTSNSQAGNGVAVNKSSLQPGDIICFSGSSKSKTISHVGIYIGGGQFIHAANSRKGVIISNVDGNGFFYVCARRVV